MNSAFDRRWVVDRLHFLHIRLGHCQSRDARLFEPDDGFYSLLETGEDSHLSEAATRISRHLSLLECPDVVYEWGIRIGHGIAGVIEREQDADRIRISLYYAGRPAALGAILAHEMTHAVLFREPISNLAPEEREPITDLTCVYLGLGKLLLNGIRGLTDEITGEGFELGYLGADMIAFAFNETNTRRGISEGKARFNLNKSGQSILDNQRQSASVMIRP